MCCSLSLHYSSSALPTLSLPSVCSATPSSPETMDFGSGLSPPSSLPQAARMAHPDVHMLPAPSLSPLSITLQTSCLLLPCSSMPKCLQRILSMALSLLCCDLLLLSLLLCLPDCCIDRAAL